MKKILVVGVGYVGLTTGACLAKLGKQVLCLDIDKKKILSLQQGKIPIYEPGLEDIVNENIQKGRLEFTTDYQVAVGQCDVIFVTVATPSLDDGSCNLQFFHSALESIAEAMKGYKLIINKSTVPVGTAHEAKKILASSGFPYDVVSNPEFLKEGSAVSDFLNPDRIVIGVESQRAKDAMEEIYAPYRDAIIFMDLNSAEMTKYASNAMLGCRISFINEIALLCEKLGGNIQMVRRGIGSDTRIGHAFLAPGVGFGGSCFPKDIKALQAMARRVDHRMPLIEAIDCVNERQKNVMGEKILSYFEGNLKGKKIALWGLSFKPGTDDIREAPSLVLIRKLLVEGAFLSLYDPIAIKNTKNALPPSPQVTFARDEYEAAQEADAVVLMTEWKQFMDLNLEKILELMKGKAFFDGRGVFQAQAMRKMGFDYFCIGEKSDLASQFL